MAAPGDCVLAIDLGTSGCKAALVTFEGEALAWESRAVETILTPGGGAEQDPDAWWSAILDASRALIRRGVVSATSVKAVCANTQGEGTVAVDETGKHLCNAILWMDTRGKSHMSRAVGGAVNLLGYSPLKLFRYLSLTGGAPSLTGKDSVGHILHLQHERPEIAARTHKYLNVLDYINLRLTGQSVSTYDSIVTTWVTDNRSLRSIRYDATLCGYLGLTPEKFPPIVPCTEIIGEVLPDFASATGIPPNTPVVAGAVDTTAAAIGSGAVREGDPHLYLGTSSWIGAHVPKKKTDIFAAIASMPCALPDKYLMVALQATAGGNLTFLRDKLLYDHDELMRESYPNDVLKVFDKLVERAPAGSRGIIYTPWIYGERAPIEDPTIRAGLHNISLDHSRSDVIRAIYEGVALNTRWLLEPVEKFIGRRVDSIAMVGGGANSDVWCQIVADALDRPMRQIAQPIESNARGSAFIAGVALGKHKFDDVHDLVKTRRVFEPQPANRLVYDFHFKEFKQLYRANKDMCRRLNAFYRR